MSSRVRDQLAGAILFVVALAWIMGVFWAIPDPAGGMHLGPRSFPIAMGLALAFLSLMLIGGTLVGRQREGAAEVGTEAPFEAWALLATFGFLIGHLLLMTWFGFVIGTVLATAAFLWFVLKQRLSLLLAGLPIGLAFGVWFVLGKLMGVYLPRGSLIDLF